MYRENGQALGLRCDSIEDRSLLSVGSSLGLTDDSIIVGYYRGNYLVYVARVRNGFVPATR
jgi:hypothetical protein